MCYVTGIKKGGHKKVKENKIPCEEMESPDCMKFPNCESCYHIKLREYINEVQSSSEARGDERRNED